MRGVAGTSFKQAVDAIAAIADTPAVNAPMNNAVTSQEHQFPRMP